jgi:hypothetical protein
VITIPGLPGTHETYASAALVELERGDGTKYRFTNAAGRITYTGAGGSGLPANGAVFFVEPFTVQGVYRGGGQVVGAIEFDDLNDTVKALARVHRVIDWRGRLWRVGIDPDFTITWIRWEAEGHIVSVDDSIKTARIEINSAPGGSEAERYLLSCPFVFGGARCGFAGDTSAGCDHTYTGGCATYSNQPRFGGFRKLPTAGDKLPEWGQGERNYLKRY